MTDPTEQSPIADPAAIDRLRDDFAQLYGTALALRSAQSKPVQLDKHTVKELQSLGYL